MKSLFKKIRYRLQGRVIHLRPRGTVKGRVLLSYIITPFLSATPDELSGHSNYWEALEIAQCFLEREYAVDVVDLRNTVFKPTHSYTFAIGAGASLERIAPLLNDSCVTIFHATESYWKFNNDAELKRLAAITERRGVELSPRRLAIPHESQLIAQEGTIIEGNDFARNTYGEGGERFYSLPLPSSHTYLFNEEKDYDAARTQFLWLGGTGAAHKGLDIVLEAFVGMPEVELVVCGKIAGEEDFVSAYHTELFETPNISVRGWMDPGSAEFQELLATSCGIILDSCAEGCAGSVVLGMHGGLIPLVSKATGVEADKSGIVIPGGSVESLREAVHSITNLPVKELARHSRLAWECARRRHTREEYSLAYRSFVDTLEKKYTTHAIHL